MKKNTNNIFAKLLTVLLVAITMSLPVSFTAFADETGAEPETCQILPFCEDT